jgi:deoxycytidine triphosphate deaminase
MGDLLLDPAPDQSQIGIISVDLRLGTQIAEFTPRAGITINLTAGVAPSEALQYLTKPIKTLGVGERFLLPPASSFLAVTLEYLKLPPDLAGVLLPRSSWTRLGLRLSPATIDPGFQGKLTLDLQNVGPASIELCAGLRVVGLALTPVAPLGVRTDHATQETATDDFIQNDLARVKSKLGRRSAALRPTKASLARIESLYSRMLKADSRQKGKALEDFTQEVFKAIKGLSVIGRNKRLRAEELDIVLRNDINRGFWRFAGSPIIIECKNWSSTVSAREISVLLKKLESISPDARAGIIIAPNGVSGSRSSDAWLLIREARQRGRYVLVIEDSDLAAVAAGTSMTEILERKYDTLSLL